MSARFNLILSFGVLAVMLLTSITTIYFTKEGRDQSARNNEDINNMREANNIRGNISQAYFDIILKNITQIENDTNNLIRDFNQTNEEERGKAVEQIVQSNNKTLDAVQNNTIILKMLEQHIHKESHNHTNHTYNNTN